IPLAANIGGIGTPVGTPPNAIAVGILANHGIRVSFTEWMVMSVPFILILLAAAWLLLIRWVPKRTTISLELTASFDRSRTATYFYLVAGLTILLWMTEPLHGVSSNVVGFIPVVLLLALRVMDGEDIQALDWPVLWLVAGGIALGDGIGRTGLDQWLLGWFDWSSMPTVAAIAALVLVAIVLGNFISNSATANLLVPLAVGFASTIGTSALILVVILALASSLGISMPISTPPNAIAFSTGVIPMKSMAVLGIFIGVFGGLLLAFVMPWFWGLLGLV
ncbi:MAG: anion permease, partial [Ruaniaceae bacterium]|nr:anion permease [Ruaniaceae bacterium]